MSAVARKAIELKTGARALRAILENLMLEVMFDLPQREDVVEVVIDEAVVKGRRRPLLKRAAQARGEQGQRRLGLSRRAETYQCPLSPFWSDRANSTNSRTQRSTSSRSTTSLGVCM